MTRQELANIIAGLGMTKAAFAREVSRLAGLNISASSLARMTSEAATGRDPSPVVQAVARMMTEHSQASELVRAVKRAGWRPS